MIQLTWAIDLHDRIFLRESKTDLYYYILPEIWHELIHAFINAFFHIDSSIQMIIKVWVDTDEIYIGGITTDSDQQHPFYRCITEFCHFFIDLINVLGKNSWNGFRQMLRTYWQNIAHFRANPQDFDERIADRLTEDQNFGEFSFRIFSYRLQSRKERLRPQ